MKSPIIIVLLFSIIVCQSHHHDHTRNSSCKNVSGYTAYVDAEVGSDFSGKLRSPCYPFATFTKAINKIQETKSVNEQWVIHTRPGVYNETVVLPGNISIIGTGPSTVIRKLVINGESSVYNLKIQPVNQGAIFIDAGEMNPVNLNNIIINHEWSSLTDTTNALFIEVLSGWTILSNSNFAAILSGNLTTEDVYFVGVFGGELNAVYSMIDVEVKSSAKNISLYKAVSPHDLESHAANLKINSGFSKLQTREPADHAYFIYTDNVNTEVFATRMNFNSKNPLNSAIVSAEASVTVKITSASLNFKTPPSNFFLVVGINVDGIGAPDVRITNCNFVNTFPPPVSGDFEKISLSGLATSNLISDNLITGGTLVGFKIIEDDYIVSHNDNILLVTVEEVTVTLPDPQELSFGSFSAGRRLTIKNSSGGYIYVSFNTPIGSRVIYSTDTMHLFTSETQWYVE